MSAYFFRVNTGKQVEGFTTCNGVKYSVNYEIKSLLHYTSISIHNLQQ